MRKYYVLGLVLLVCFSCDRSPVDSLNGNWKSIGSGWLLQIQDSTNYSFFDITELSCLPTREGPLSELLTDLDLDNDTLSLRRGVITYKFVPFKKLPEECYAELDPLRAESALYNFEVFSQTVKEHYAFMDSAAMPWDSLYNEQRNKILYDPTDATLYETLEETLELLNDNHGFLEASDSFYESYQPEYEPESEEASLPEYGDFQVAAMVTDAFLEEDLTVDSPLINWGKINDSLGYIQIKAMWLFADLDIPEEMIAEYGYVDAYVRTFQELNEGDYIAREVEAVSKIMDRVMEDLSDTQAIVIDVRFNGGGQDAVSFEILSRFTDKKLQVATQKLKAGDGFSPVLSLFIQGKPDAYLKPVFVLTSPQTGSAAEAFSIATMAMDNIMRVGSPTSGAMSTALEKALPNGWHFAISNEVYMDNSGKGYEYLGVPTDIDIPYPNGRQEFFRSVVNDLEGDKRTILKAVGMQK